MYKDYETPIISANISYYDKEYSPQLAETAVQCFEKYCLFPPERVILDGRGRFKKYRPAMRENFVEAYSKKDILGLAWETASSNKTQNYLFANWVFTFYKKSKIVGEPVVVPWNCLMLHATHTWIEKEQNYSSFFRCIKDLVEIFHPFHVDIDDVSNSVALSRNAKQESLLVPRHLHTPLVEWGNYWGPDICGRYDISALEKLPLAELEHIAGGIYFTLSDHALKFDTPECRELREEIQTKVLNLR